MILRALWSSTAGRSIAFGFCRIPAFGSPLGELGQAVWGGAPREFWRKHHDSSSSNFVGGRGDVLTERRAGPGGTVQRAAARLPPGDRHPDWDRGLAPVRRRGRRIFVRWRVRRLLNLVGVVFVRRRVCLQHAVGWRIARAVGRRVQAERSGAPRRTRRLRGRSEPFENRDSYLGNSVGAVWRQLRGFATRGAGLQPSS